MPHRCCQHLQDSGNPQPISSLITILILGESLCLSFLIIRIATCTSHRWLWSHLSAEGLRVWKQLQASSRAEPSRGWETFPRSTGSTVSRFYGAVGMLLSSPCRAGSEHHARLQAVVTGQHCQFVPGGWEMPAQPFPRAPQWSRLCFHTVLFSRIVL